MASNTFSGARAIFLIDNVPLAYAGGMSGEEMVEHEPVEVLGLLEVREHVPVAYRTSLNAQLFRVVQESIKALGILPNIENIITSDDLTAAVQDIVTRDTVSLFQGVRCAGQTFDITANGLVQSNVSFVATKLFDESQI